MHCKSKEQASERVIHSAFSVLRSNVAMNVALLVTSHYGKVRETHLSHHLHDDALECRAPEEQAHNLDQVLVLQATARDGAAHTHTVHNLHSSHVNYIITYNVHKHTSHAVHTLISI